jgi:hypothetical protein
MPTSEHTTSNSDLTPSTNNNSNNRQSNTPNSSSLADEESENEPKNSIPLPISTKETTNPKTSDIIANNKAIEKSPPNIGKLNVASRIAKNLTNLHSHAVLNESEKMQLARLQQQDNGSNSDLSTGSCENSNNYRPFASVANQNSSAGSVGQSMPFNLTGSLGIELNQNENMPPSPILIKLKANKPPMSPPRVASKLFSFILTVANSLLLYTINEIY